MVKITEALIRKKAEHNECIIGTLEELSLHQEDVEKIEHINNWCKDLQILYLQANLISKIENLNKLKKLKYLNLAINNIEIIENLERCESLEKLDLTLNFIGELESVKSLEKNYNLKYLYLTGNPCCDFPGYREYVLAKLPQLESLDSTEILKSERLKAFQHVKSVEIEIKKAQNEYKTFREQQKNRMKNSTTNELNDEDFWKSTSENCPESRVEIAERSKKNRNAEEEKEKKEKPPLRLFHKDGRPLNINQAKVNFFFKDDDPSKYVLDVEVYKHLDTNLIKVDLQPIYVTIEIKGKIFQMVFPEEISIDKCTVKRSQTTGYLVVEMPKANYNITIKKPIEIQEKKQPPPAINNNRQDNFLEVNDGDNSGFLELTNENKVPPLEYAF